MMCFAGSSLGRFSGIGGDAGSKKPNFSGIRGYAGSAILM
jgi:hypothetical protein